MNFKSMSLVGVMLMLLVSVAVMGYLTYTVSASEEYVTEATGTASDTNRRIVTEGTNGSDIWKNNKYVFAMPTVMNLIGVVVLGVLAYGGGR